MALASRYASRRDGYWPLGRRRRYSLVVALTDAEEMGLRGALALRDDPAWAAVRVFLNFEAVGTSGPSALFEAGPGNAWLVKAWARHAPSPFGGSFATEVYRHLPNSTDFAVLAGHDRPGLNFAPIGNSYAYHTHLDTPERLSDKTIAQTGSGAVAIVEALDREDLSRRTTAVPLFFDVGGLRGVVAEEGVVRWLAGLAIVLALAALIRLVIAVRGSVGLAPLLWSAAWALAGVVVVTVFMVAAGWVLRAASGVNHPWYAHPDRHFAVLGTAGVLGWWFARWIAARVPPRFGPCRHPACAWGLILLVWIAVAALAVRFAPGASYLLTIPLLCAGLTLVIVNARSRTAVRLASIVPAAAAVLLCLRPAWMLLHFMVPNFGRQAMVTPVFVYPAMLLVCALLLLLPVLPLFVRGSARPVHPSTVTAVILLAFASAFGLALAAPAYDAEHPRYCQAQYVQDATLDKAWWEIGANEDGVVPVDTAEAPAGWARATGRLPLSTRLDSMGGPFVFRAPARAGLAPAARFTTGVEPRGDVIEVTIRIARVEEGSTVVVSLPERVSALASRPPGAVRLGHWQSRLIAPPPGGVEFHLTLRAADAAALANARLLVFTRGLPGGDGPLGLPAWLPQTDAAWYARTVSILPIQSQ